MKIALLQANVTTGDVVGNTEKLLDLWRKGRDIGADLCAAHAQALFGPDAGAFLRQQDFVRACDAALARLGAETADGPPLLLGDAAGDSVVLHPGPWQKCSRYPGHLGIATVNGQRFCLMAGPLPVNDPGPRLRQAQAIIHLGGLAFAEGGQQEHEQACAEFATSYKLPFLSVNLVGGYGQRIHAGQSFALGPDGRCTARAAAFAEDILLADCAAPAPAQEPALPEDEAALWQALVTGTRDFVRKSGADRAIVGLSGGMDSALVLAIAAEALGAEKLLAVLMPSPYSSEGSVQDSLALCANLGVKPLTLPIEPLMKGFADVLAPGLGLYPAYEGEVTFENLQARIRGMLLVSLANRARALVLNTSNKSEAAVGYSTLYGDTVGALAVIGDVTKSRVYELARHLNARAGHDVIPQAIIDKAPSAELRPGQKDADSLPPYDRLDPALERVLANGRAESPLEADVRRRLFNAEFKRRQEPPALIVSRTSLGHHWQAPIAARYNLPE